MDKIIIQGGKKLEGRIRVNSSKNAILPMIAAALLADGEVILEDVPPLRDIRTMTKIIEELGTRVNYNPDSRELSLCVESEENFTAGYELVKQMRASICVLGPLLAKRKVARVSMPGGCVIGPRPIDLHLKGLKAMGADINLSHGYINARGRNLRGKTIHLTGAFGSSVLATGNVMMAAVLADGETIIKSSACEPEVVDLGNFLNSMGAKVTGLGSPEIHIEGVKNLIGTRYRVIPDRIEAGTFILAAAITQGAVTVENIIFEHDMLLLDILKNIGVGVTLKDGNSVVIEGKGRIKPFDITTMPYPGFPTDLQAQLMALLALADGTSVITEKIYPDRFIHTSELVRMGADISVELGRAVVRGVPHLSGANVMASDLRASAALILAGLVAQGHTEIDRVYHIDRGYESIDARLMTLGAEIERVKT